MTCKRRCLEPFLFFFFFISRRRSCGHVASHSLGEKCVFHACFPLRHIRSVCPSRTLTNKPQRARLLFFKWGRMSYCFKRRRKKSIQVSKELSNEAAHLTRSHHQSKYYRQPQNKLYSREVLVITLALSLSLPRPLCSLALPLPPLHSFMTS